MKSRITIILLLIIGVNLHAFGKKETTPQLPEPEEAEPAVIIPEVTRAERTMKALLEAYPQHIERIEFRNDDWALLLNNKWYYYADSKMLPEEHRGTPEKFRAVQFYVYPAELPPFVERSAEDSPRLLNIRTSRRNDTLSRSDFFEELLQVRTRDEAYANTRIIRFFGKSMRVHTIIQPVLARIEELILAEAKTDPKIQTWINGLNTPEAWNWRPIAESQFRSYHSFGVAVDLLPKSLQGKQTYWLWSADWRDDWWNTPYTDRYHPPEFVIKTFESFGFVWGGKWFLFDTMHFEYRPEVFILNGLPLETIR